MEESGGSLEQALFEIRRVIAGQEEMLERVLVCLLAGGHVLIEGVPGLAKTLTIKTTAAVLGGSFQRVQFTPDLVPSDLVGTRVYRPDRTEFETELGPVFCNFLLADEINRAPAKVQSALLEVMQERQVTIGHNTYPVPEPFLVLATQNPIESGGHLSAAGGAGRPLHAQGARRLPGSRRGADGRRALARTVARTATGAIARRAEGAAAAGRRGLRRPGADQLDGRRRDRDAPPARARPRRDRRLHRVRREPARADQPRRGRPRAGADPRSRLRRARRSRRTRARRVPPPARALVSRAGRGGGARHDPRHGARLDPGTADRPRTEDSGRPRMRR